MNAFPIALQRVFAGLRVLWICIGLFICSLYLPVYGRPLPEIVPAMVITILLLITIKTIREGGIRIPTLALVLGLYVIYMWAAVPKSLLPITSVNRLYYLLPILLIFLISVTHINEKEGKTWEYSLILFVVLICALEALFGLYWLSKWLGISKSILILPPIGYRIQGFLLPGSNFTSVLLSLVLPFMTIRFIRDRNPRKTWLWAFVILVLLTIELLSSSRGGWIAGAAAIGTAILFHFDMSSWIRRRSTALLKAKSWIQRAGRVIISVGLVMVIVFVFLYYSQITPGHFGLFSGRDFIWEKSLVMWAQSPWFGHGAGTYPIYYALLVGLPPGWLAADSHNLWLEIAAENGLVGIVFSLLITFFIIRAAIRVWNAVKSNDEKRARASAYLGAGVGVFVASLSGFFFQIPIYTILCLILLSLFMKLDDTNGLAIGKVIAAVTTSVILILFGASYLFISRGASDFAKGSQVFVSGNHYRGMQILCNARSEAPDVSFYKFQCGFAAADVFSQTNGQQTLDLAIQSLQAGLSQDPFWPIHKANLAILEWRAGDRMEAFNDMQDVVQQAPNNALFAINLGWMAEQLGFPTVARTFYTQAILIDPWLVTSAFFKVNPLRQAVVHATSLPEGSVGFRIAAFRANNDSDFTSAADYIEQALEEDPLDAEAIALKALLVKDKDLGKAWFLAQESIFLDPRNPRTLVWAAQVAIKTGDEEKAALFIQYAFSIWNQKKLYDTDEYYLSVYQPSLFGTTYIPGYIRADLSQEMTDAFLWLASNYQSAGEKAKAEEIMTALRMEAGVGP